MIRTRTTLAALAALVVAAPLVAAAAEQAPISLDALLEKTRTNRATQAKQNEAREKEFLENRDKQKAILADAIKARDAAEARSKALSATFDANEQKLAELQEVMTARVGSLGELFGVVRQVAGDGSSIMYNSLISAQYPKRDEFFASLGKAKKLPSIEELERLWFEIQREMTESGQVARFKTTITEADGTPTEAEVVRIGGFIAMSDGRYLNYLPSVGTLNVLPRQPSGYLVGFAKKLQAATNGDNIEAAVDPSRGALLQLVVQRPNWIERIQHGEKVNYVILFVGFIGAICAIYQAIWLILTRAKVRRQLANLDRPTDDNPLGRVLSAVKADPGTIEEDAEVVELRISEAVLREVPKLERFQAFLRLAVAAGPLLGLIGTVLGMIITFQSITESGSSDPRLMAHGISAAMIATVLGLGIAIPLLFANAGLASMSRTMVQILDEQSTGMLAESLERAKEREQGGLLGGRRPEPHSV
ncbi:MAG TPA: MotA/TolQ/ExbB proton channel family protein [Myxococcota bacterium]|nr:MotA/TolQ/ExbB proton channel family protein [Myxococcota bacterium]